MKNESTNRGTRKKNNQERTSPFTDINGMVAELLDDVAERPVPRGAKARLTEIRQAVAEGNASIDMALDIIEFFPNEKAAEHFAVRAGRMLN